MFRHKLEEDWLKLLSILTATAKYEKYFPQLADTATHQAKYKVLFHECITFVLTRVYCEYMQNKISTFIPYIDYFNHEQNADVMYVQKNKDGEIISSWRYKNDLEVICLQDYEHFYG